MSHNDICLNTIQKATTTTRKNSMFDFAEPFWKHVFSLWAGNTQLYMNLLSAAQLQSVRVPVDTRAETSSQ